MTDLVVQQKKSPVKKAGDVFENLMERFKNYQPTPEDIAWEEALQKEETEKNRRAALEAEENRIMRMRIPLRYHGLTLDNYQTSYKAHEDVIKFLRTWANRETSDMENLIIHGPPGTGKTHMVCAFLQWCHRYRTEYWKLSDIIRTVKNNFYPYKDDGETELHFIKRLADIPILVIDEIGRQGGTAFEGSFMFDLLDDRYDNLLPTILISNLPVEGEPSMTSYLGISVMDRINENSLDIPCEWGNYREHDDVVDRTRTLEGELCP
ncbi:MAG: ATP-binding protein [Dysgonamonadaceae bacterium]|jgi:DNA replication protein DnaC|nr:ATP-binding protein [Dysgonamonadaceae bacterium]